MYPQLGAGGLHVFASAGSPVGTRPTGARSRTTSSRSAQLYDGARFFWAVPDYVPADQVAALPGLVRPEVTERMATLVVQGTTPGRGADDALSGARPLVRPGRGRLDLPGRGPGRSSRPSTLGSPPGTGSSPALAGAPPERGPLEVRPLDDSAGRVPPTRPGLADREPRRVRAAARAHARRPAAGPLHPRATAMDYAVSVDGLDLLSTARRFMNEHSDDVRRWFG